MRPSPEEAEQLRSASQAPLGGDAPEPGPFDDMPPHPEREAALPVRRYSSAGGVVVDPEVGHVLVLERPGRLGPGGEPEVRLPKGHIEAGESRQVAALREVFEEAGVADAEIIADLGHQVVEFTWQQHRTIRDESFFLMSVGEGARSRKPEHQFLCSWLTWEEALCRLTYEAEREWVRRAQLALSRRNQQAPQTGPSGPAPRPDTPDTAPASDGASIPP